jgi:hypothetical protein
VLDFPNYGEPFPSTLDLYVHYTNLLISKLYFTNFSTSLVSRNSFTPLANKNLELRNTDEIICEKLRQLGFAKNYVPFVKILCHGFATTRKIGLHIQCYIGIMNALTNMDHAQWSLILVVKFCSAFTKYSRVSTVAA